MARVSKPDFWRCSWVTPLSVRVPSSPPGTTWCPPVLDTVDAHPGRQNGVTVSIFSRHKTTLPTADEALPGRATSEFVIAPKHRVLDAPVVTPTAPEGYEVAIFGLGCFWGAEEIYWQKPGVWLTSVGYAGGTTPNPSYEEVCSGRTGHTEAVRIVFDP